MTRWLVILGMAAVTYVLRALPLVVSWGKVDRVLERGLRYIPPALFAALIVPSLLAPAGTPETGPRLWAGLFGVGGRMAHAEHPGDDRRGARDVHAHALD